MLFAEADPMMFVLPMPVDRPRCGGGRAGWRRAPPIDMLGPLLWGLPVRGLQSHCPTSVCCESETNVPHEGATPRRSCPPTACHGTSTTGQANSRTEGATEKTTGASHFTDCTKQQVGTRPWHGEVDMSGFRPADIHVSSHEGGFHIRATRITSQHPGMTFQMQLSHFVETPPDVERRNVHVWLSADGVLHFAEKDAGTSHQNDTVNAGMPQKGEITDTNDTRTTECDCEEAELMLLISKASSTPGSESTDLKATVQNSNCSPKTGCMCVTVEGSQTNPDSSEELVLATEDKEYDHGAINAGIVHDVTTKDNDICVVIAEKNEEHVATDNDGGVQYVMINAFDLHDVTTKDDDIDITTKDDASDVTNEDDDVTDVTTKYDDKDNFTVKEDSVHGISTKDDTGNVATTVKSATIVDNIADDVKTVTDATGILAESQNATFRLCLNVSGYDPKDIKVKVVGRQVAVQAERSDVTDGVETLHQLSRTFTLPPGVDANTVRSTLTLDGNMIIFGQRDSEQPPLEKIAHIQRVE